MLASTQDDNPVALVNIGVPVCVCCVCNVISRYLTSGLR